MMTETDPRQNRRRRCRSASRPPPQVGRAGRTGDRTMTKHDIP